MERQPITLVHSTLGNYQEIKCLIKGAVMAMKTMEKAWSYNRGPILAVGVFYYFELSFKKEVVLLSEKKLTHREPDIQGMVLSVHKSNYKISLMLMSGHCWVG